MKKRINKYRLIAIYILWVLIHILVWIIGGMKKKSSSLFDFSFDVYKDMISFIYTGHHTPYIIYTTQNLLFYTLLLPGLILIIYLITYLWNKK